MVAVGPPASTANSSSRPAPHQFASPVKTHVQWALTANSRSAAYSSGDKQLLDAARWEHRETTEVARRALRVVTETTEVAQQTLDRAYHQGQQIERAGHGIEQIDENVAHASRIVAFMGRFCCFRAASNDPDIDLEQEWHSVAERRRMDGVLAADGIAAVYDAKWGAVGLVLSKRAPLTGSAADAAAGSAAADAAAATGKEAWSELIAAVPGPLGRLHAKGCTSMPTLGHGLEDRDRQQLQAETAKQDTYLDQISGALDSLQSMGMALGQELDGQVGAIDALQRRAEETGQGLRGVASGAAKLAGPAPCQTTGGSWQHEQDAATQAVARAVLASAPLSARYRIR